MKALWIRLRSVGIHIWWMTIIMWIAIISAYLFSVILPIMSTTFLEKGWIGDFCYCFIVITYPTLTIGLIIKSFLKVYKNIIDTEKLIKGIE